MGAALHRGCMRDCSVVHLMRDGRLQNGVLLRHAPPFANTVRVLPVRSRLCYESLWKSEYSFCARVGGKYSDPWEDK